MASRIACRLTTFGSLVLFVGDALIAAPATQKARAILAYCVLNRRSNIARERLLELFWPDIDPERSRASLSTALHSIRRGFRDAALDSEQFFEANKSIVRWTAEIAVDVEEFRARAAGAEPADWDAALRVADGEFLEGDYDEWTVSLREELTDEREALLTRAVATSADVSLARELIARNPYSEEGYAALIASNLAAGRTNAAIDLTQRYLEALREIDAAASDEFTARYGALLRAPATAAQGSSLPLPFVGRETELRALRAHVEGLAGGAGSVVMLLGEPGIGKSALVAQLLDSTAVARWHVACSDDDPRVFGPWENVFNELIGEPIETVLASGDATPAIVIAERIGRALGTTPHIVVVDDVQYLRGEALDVLLHVVRGTCSRHALVLAMRPEGERLVEPLFATETVVEIRLAPLSREAFDFALGGAARDGAFVDAVFERTSGHPLFFQQLVAQLVRDGALERRGRVWRLAKPLDGQLPLPASVRRSIEGRLRSRGPQTALVATVLALDNEADVSHIAAICGLDEERVLDAIDDLLALAVIAESTSGPHLTFTHDLIREVAGSLASNARRRAFHTELAKRLETVAMRNVPMRRARHLAAAGIPEAAAQAYMQAVMEAFEWDAYRDAIVRADLALAQVGKMQQTNVRRRLGAQAMALKGGGLANLYRIDEAWDIATQAVREARGADDPMVLARTLLARGHVASQMDDGIKQLTDADEVIALGRPSVTPVQLAQALYQRATAIANLARIDDAAAAATAVVDFVAPIERWILGAAALNELLPLQAAHWRFAEAATSTDLALACARKTGRNMEASTLTVVAFTAYLRDEFEILDDHLERIGALLDDLKQFPEAAEFSGFRTTDMLFTVHYLRGMRLRATGRPSEALDSLRALAEFEDLIRAPYQGNAYRYLAIDVACDLSDAELLAAVPAHLSSLTPNLRQMKFGMSGCAELARARFAVATRDPSAAELVRAAHDAVERNAAMLPLDCIRTLRDVERAAAACGAGDVAGRAEALRQAYERRHSVAMSEGTGTAATQEAAS
jgi:DNA-binding SARP family transcriptional activator